MSLRWFCALTVLGSFVLFCGLRLHAEDPTASSSKTPDSSRPRSEAAAAKSASRPPPFPISAEKIAEIEAATAKFCGDPQSEDFDALEAHAAFIRSAPGPMPSGGQWLIWFYGNLAAPEKRDSDSWKKHFEKLDRWIAAKPESVTPVIIAARAHIARGWEERGGGFANTVSEARWVIFHDQIERATELLEQARDIKDHDADVYLQLIEVGKSNGADHDDIEEYVAAARKISPDYHAVCTEAAVYLLPRWHGEPGDIGKFADKMLKENPGDEGLEIYARIACMLHRYDRTLMLSGELDLEKICDGARVLQRRFPNSAYYQNFAGLVAWRTQDLELAKAAKEFVDKDFDQAIWGNPAFAEEFRRFCSLTIAPPSRQRILWSVSGLPIVTAISPSGNSLVVGEQTGVGATSMAIRNLKDLSLIEELSGAGNLPDSLDIDCAGTRLAVSFQAYPPARVPSRLVLYTVGDWDNPQYLADPRVSTFGALRFSPDGKQLAVAHRDNGIGIWNVETQKLERLVESVPHVRSIFFSPDGKLLVGQNESRAMINETATGNVLHRLPLAEAADGARIKTVLAFLEDGRLLAVGTQKDRPGTSLFSWDRVSKKRRDLIAGMPGTVCAVSPKLTFVVLMNSTVNRETRAAPTSLSIWSVKEGRRLAEFGVVAPPAGMAFSQDEKTLSFASQDRSVRLWDLSEFLPKDK